MNLRIFKFIGILSAFLLINSTCQVETEEKLQPNIIFILADDLGYGDISAYGNSNKIKTPNIDGLAAEGMRFTDAHTPSSVCTPTRYGVLTGRYNWRTKLKSGVLTGISKALIPKSRATVASILQGENYKTAFIGKWHLGWDWAKKDSTLEDGAGWDEKDFNNIDFTKPITNSPNDLGFDYAYGHAGSLDMAPYVYVENARVTEIPDSATVNTGKYSWWRKGPTSKDFIHEEVTPHFFKKAIKYVRNQAKEKHPFFLYLPLPSPHTPILPSKEWQDKSNLNPYGDFVLMIDDYVGRLLSAIEEEGIKNNTIVIFTSDNGCSPAAKIDEMIEKGHYPNGIYRGHKADIFEGGHRVPFIVRWPNEINQGVVSDETICLTDLMATCAEIVGHSLMNHEGEDSYSLMPLFKNKALQSSFREATVHHSINGSFAIRKDEWKLILCPDSGGWSDPKPSDKNALDTLPEIQLYNLKDDPSESYNIQDAEKDKVRELKSLLIKYITEGRSTPGEIQKNDSIESEWKQIKFIDYIGYIEG